MIDSPFLLGFDQFESALDRLQRGAAVGYPPYNIELVSDTLLRITIAVAGFEMSDLSVQLEQNQLVIRGRKQAEDVDDQRVYLHRGIANRQFQRSFILSDDIEVISASLDNGLLNVDLRRILPETTVQTIAITSGKDSKKSHTIDVSSDKPAEKN